MTALPLDIGTIHFVGIGGIGMSGIAEVMHNLGYRVQGSDLRENPNVRRLRALGVTVLIGHDQSHVEGVAVLVVSSAVPTDNPEVAAARARLLPVVRRAEMLAELMRLKSSIAVGGTHGKTTTTSMIAALLDAAGMDPTVINGGIINAYGTNARLGAGEWMVVEADESDGTFVRLPATIAVVTNINAEHMEHYGDFETLRAAFQSFVENIPFYGFATLCIDHPEVQAMIGRISDRRIVTYGLSPQADVRAVDPRADGEGTTFDVEMNARAPDGARADAIYRDLRLRMPGAHNVQNALAAIAIAAQLGVDEDTLRRGLLDFAGVKRRFTKTGEARGITVIDDYGHHPVEIAAALAAARQTCDGKLIAVVQPHRYTRLRDLFEDFCACFNDADVVIVADVYAAGEAPIEGFDRDALVAGLQSRGHRRVIALDDERRLAAVVGEETVAGDMVICLGAGNITSWAQALPGELAADAPDTARGGAS